jgi:hypothetical protein
MFDVFYQGPKPNLFPFEQPANSLEQAASLSRTKFFWYIDGQNDYTGFDFNFRAVPWEQHQIHTWPNQWQPDGGTYFANKYTVQEKVHNFHTDTYTHRLPNLANWEYRDCQPNSIDSRWAPDPLDPPYIYQFPVKWGRDQVDGPQYRVPGATEVKYLYDFTAEFNTQMAMWTVPEEINADDIDFSWRPDPTHPPYIYHFSSAFQVSSGLTYTVPGAVDVKFVDMIPSKTGNAIQTLDIFFVDKSNASATARYKLLADEYPHVQKIRYANSMMDTIARCITRSKTSKFWVISSENIYTDFDFSWHAEPWQGHMLHVFGSQHQKWSDTYLINRSEFIRCSSWAKGLEDFPNLHFVTDQPVYIPSDLHDIYYVDHSNNNDQIEQLREKHSGIKSTRYVNNYLDTFKRIMTTASTEHVWIISSLCDYSRFDFSWQPEPWQKEMIHVFPSADQPRGDTFYIHVESFKKQMDKLELLDWFDVINYCEEQRVPRLPIPVCEYQGDNLIGAIKQHEFNHPYTWFVPNFCDLVHNPSIWGEKDKKIVSFSSGNRTILVPREAKNYITTQAYDYPYIDKMPTILDKPLDIIYISNSEPDADKWYDHLCNVVGNTTICKRVQNVNGRTAAYRAAAELSETPWFFTVFAKLEVVEDFDWTWQPDYLQGLKHYIFHSKNPVNGLEYGHMGVIAYNKQLVLDTHVPGLDFTLSRAHAVIPRLSAIAHYNTTPELTWRTAFRECIKLYNDVNKTASVESQYRLETWLGQAEGENAMWSLLGARDAVDYWNNCQGQHEFLMLTYEWKWLSDYYAKIYTPNAKFNDDYIDESHLQPIQLPGRLALGK